MFCVSVLSALSVLSVSVCAAVSLPASVSVSEPESDVAGGAGSFERASWTDGGAFDGVSQQRGRSISSFLPRCFGATPACSLHNVVLSCFQLRRKLKTVV